MHRQRKQNSTSNPIQFLMIDNTDHVSAKTGLNPAVTLSKNGGAFAGATGAITEVGSGWYSLAGNAGDRDTLGELLVHATAAGADPFDGIYEIVKFDPFADPTTARFGYLDNLDGIVANIWSYATRTLTSFGTLVSDIWSNTTRTLTQTASSIVTAVSGTNLTFSRAVTWSATLTISDITGWTKLYFTIKKNRADDDDESWVQIVKSNPAAAGDGLQHINGEEADTEANGSITVNSVTSITIKLEAVEAQKLSTDRGLYYDVKYMKADGTFLASQDGLVDIEDVVTESIT